MEPPPASLEAMVRSRPGSPLTPEPRSPWIWVVVAVIVVIVIAYYLEFQRPS